MNQDTHTYLAPPTTKKKMQQLHTTVVVKKETYRKELGKKILDKSQLQLPKSVP
jgi:hypothetical protein